MGTQGRTASLEADPQFLTQSSQSPNLIPKSGPLLKHLQGPSSHSVKPKVLTMAARPCLSPSPTTATPLTSPPLLPHPSLSSSPQTQTCQARALLRTCLPAVPLAGYSSPPCSRTAHPHLLLISVQCHPLTETIQSPDLKLHPFCHHRPPTLPPYSWIPKEPPGPHLCRSFLKYGLPGSVY